MSQIADANVRARLARISNLPPGVAAPGAVPAAPSPGAGTAPIASAPPTIVMPPPASPLRPVPADGSLTPQTAPGAMPSPGAATAGRTATQQAGYNAMMGTKYAQAANQPGVSVEDRGRLISLSQQHFTASRASGASDPTATGMLGDTGPTSATAIDNYQTGQAAKAAVAAREQFASRSRMLPQETLNAEHEADISGSRLATVQNQGDASIDATRVGANAAENATRQALATNNAARLPSATGAAIAQNTLAGAKAASDQGTLQSGQAATIAQNTAGAAQSGLAGRLATARTATVPDQMNAEAAKRKADVAQANYIAAKADFDTGRAGSDEKLQEAKNAVDMANANRDKAIVEAQTKAYVGDGTPGSGGGGIYGEKARMELRIAQGQAAEGMREAAAKITGATPDQMRAAAKPILDEINSRAGTTAFAQGHIQVHLTGPDITKQRQNLTAFRRDTMAKLAKYAIYDKVGAANTANAILAEFPATNADGKYVAAVAGGSQTVGYANDLTAIRDDLLKIAQIE